MTIRNTQGPARAQRTRRTRRARGYPRDPTDAQWQVIAVHLPAARAGRRGRPRVWPRRRIIEAILYLDRAGCAWRYLPADFPPWQTVCTWFAAWRDDGTLARLHAQLRAQARIAAGRQPQPTAAFIESPSSTGIKALEKRIRDLAAHRSKLMIVGVTPDTARVLHRSGLTALIGEHNVMLATDEVFGALNRATSDAQAWIAARPAGPA